MSFKNKASPRIEPGGTPTSLYKKSQSTPFTGTQYRRSVEKDSDIFTQIPQPQYFPV